MDPKKPKPGESKSAVVERASDFLNNYLYKEFSIHAPNITAESSSEHSRAKLVSGFETQAQKHMSDLVKAGHLAIIDQVTGRFNKSGIDHTIRYLLSEPSIYVSMLSKVMMGEKVIDVAGVFSRVKANAREVVAEFYGIMLEIVLVNNNIDISEISMERLYHEVLQARPAINNAEAAVMRLLREQERLGQIPALVDNYFRKGEVDAIHGTPAIKRIMANYLLELGLKVPDSYRANNPGDDRYDEALFVAYNHARKRIGDGNDPINNVYSSAGDGTWDFAVDTFETTEGQGIDAENIKAASVLFYIYMLGDRMGIFRVADSVLLSWTKADISFPQGEFSDKLYRYFKKKEDRTSEEERGLFYNQVLSIGNTDVLDGMTTNSNFISLWDRLMEETASFIDLRSSADSVDSISRIPIYRAMQDIQYNLSTHCSGLAKTMTREMYAHLQSAIEILRAPEVTAQLSGRSNEKSIWKVIESVSKAQYNTIPNVNSLKTAAVEGHKILRYISGFDEASITDGEFNALLDSCQSFIIAQSQIGEGDEMASGPRDEMAQLEGAIDGADDDWGF